MTIVIQHQYRDLGVTEHSFEIGLSFGGIPERLLIPFDSITKFVDPSVSFGLQFELLTATEASEQENVPSADMHVLPPNLQRKKQQPEIIAAQLRSNLMKPKRKIHLRSFGWISSVRSNTDICIGVMKIKGTYLYPILSDCFL